MATYYVGIGGNDANAGTSWALRKLTLNGAEDIPVAAGDTVYVGPGTYRELLTVDVSGTAGNLITYTADYTGANTSGLKGIVRITGSADDIARTRANCVSATSKDYRKFSGFCMDTTSGDIMSLATACSGWVIEKCHLSAPGVNSNCVNMDGTGTANTIDRCFLYVGAANSATSGVRLNHSSFVDNAGHVIKNSIILNAAIRNISINRIGGVTVQNCIIAGAASHNIDIATVPNAGQVITVQNCIIADAANTGLRSASAGFMTEDYNTLFGCATARTNVTAGANSVTRPALFDPRWFFEMVAGGRMVTPFDLASYSTLVEYNSGTGAPSTDLRGASAVGTYREWGTLEHNATYNIAPGASRARVVNR